MRITRREFVKRSGLGAAVVAGATRIGAAAPTARRPNILLFITDDQGWRDCASYGSRYVRTPNFDRIAREGILFQHAYVSAPSCTPSRASLLTGRNFWELGTGSVLHGPLPTEFVVYPDLLEAQGYQVGLTGKGWGPGSFQASGRPRNPAGPSYVKVRFAPKPPPEFSDIDYAANFREFLQQRTAGRPFCFWVGTTEPHHPHNASNHEKLPFPYSDIELPPFLAPTDGNRLERANYFGEVEYADQRLGEVLTALQDAGELENTLILATGDNGTPVPRGKGNMYDWGMRVPLAAMWPGRIRPGRVVDDIVSLRDCAATFLEAAGVPVPTSMSARSFLNVLLAEGSGLADPSRSWVTGGLEWHDRSYPTRMLRTHQYLYIRNYSDGPRVPRNERAERPDADFAENSKTVGIHALLRMHPDHPVVKPYHALAFGPRPAEELYDCERDPWQMQNVAGLPEHEGVRRELAARLDAYQKQTGDPRATGRTEILERAAAAVEEQRRQAAPQRRN